MTEKARKQEPSIPATGFERIEDFYVDYSNNIFLESSAWDLKLIFGQLDQSTNPPTTEQRSAITIPWRQAKILAYLLRIHIRAHELDSGSRITIPKNLVPPDPIQDPDQPDLDALYDYMKKLRQDVFGEDLK